MTTQHKKTVKLNICRKISLEQREKLNKLKKEMNIERDVDLVFQSVARMYKDVCHDSLV